MHVAHEQAMKGVAEIPGPRNHPQIIEYFRTVKGLEQFKLTDETPWCSAFVNWCMAQVGGERSESPLARSWSRIGSDATTPREGDVVVFHSTANQINGHVGFFTCFSQDRRWVLVLGGNQGNRVSYQWYEINGRALRLASYRRIDL